MPIEYKQNKIKCLFIIDQLIRFAGTEKHLYQITSRLNQRSFLCKIVAFQTNPYMVETFSNAGILIQHLDLNKIYEIKSLKKFIELVSIIRLFKPDIVQSFHFKSDTFGVCAAKIAGVKYLVSSRRDMGDLKTKRQILLNRCINPLITNCISVCDRVKDELQKYEKIPLKKIQTIYNGVDLKNYNIDIESKNKARKKMGICEDDFVVGIVCIFRPEKDVRLFFNAISDIKNFVKKLKIIAVGDGEEKASIMQFCVDNNLFDNTIFTGYVQDTREYIQAMDIVCLTPRENEGLSNVIIEEMAMGKPVIATDVGGNAELVSHGITGFIIPPKDKKALGDAIIKLYNDPELRCSMGDNGRKKIESQFTIQNMVHNHANFYNNLIELS